MSWETLSLVLAIHAVALVSPGPDFAIVTRLSIVAGRRAGIAAAAGVATAIGVYVLVCVLGLSLLLAALPGLARALAILGSLYLAWLAWQCLRSRGEMPATAAAPGQARKAFLTGFMTNLLNPKAMFYFGSILSQTIGPGLSGADASLLWSLLVGESLLWFAVVATLFSSPFVLAWLRRRLVWFERAIGLALLALAAKLALAAAR